MGFPTALMYTAARLYYLEDATQAEVAARLGVSRPTVSRLLAEARRAGIVRIEVVAPVDTGDRELAGRVAAALGLRRVYLPPAASGATGEVLAPALAEALRDAGLSSGDVLLVSSGRTIYEAAQAELPELPGVVVAPMVGGQDEPEAWYATNEITRQVAARIHGTPAFLYAPALPAPQLHDTLLADAATRRVVEMWATARCAILGVGAPLATRTRLPRFVPEAANDLSQAVADICSRFFDAEGTPVTFPGSERLMATPLERLPEIPTAIALAAGVEKLPGLLAGARARYFNVLVTDATTARRLLVAAGEDDATQPARGGRSALVSPS